MKKDNESIEKDKKNNQNDLDSTLGNKCFACFIFSIFVHLALTLTLEYISLTLKASIAGLFLCIGLISLIIGIIIFNIQYIIII